jgi:hypothetical protein
MAKSFKDKPNTAVFTTKFVMYESHLITYVAHDSEDGTWQFLSDDEIPNMQEMAMLVTLTQVLKVDPTLLELADLPLGYCATRESASDKWKTEKL